MICAWCGGETDEPTACSVCGKPPLLQERYRLDDRLGKRGASTTYKAFDEQEQRLVVVKELLLRAVSDAKELELFEREAALLERIDHPGVPKFLDHLEWSRGKQVGLYIVQEFLDGESIASELTHHRPSEEEVAQMLADVLDILGALRRLGVVHRDIKPANLLRTDAGVALVDFGAGRAVAESIYRAGSTVTGTFGYMAPEQMLAQAVPASDVYGLGATAVRLLTGRDPSELIAEHGRLSWRDAAPGVSTELAGVVDAMLAPDADARPSDLEGLARDLREFAGGNPAKLASFRRVTALAAAAQTAVERPSRTAATIGIVRFAGFSVAATAATAALLSAFLYIQVAVPPLLLLAVLTIALGALATIRVRRIVRHYRIARTGVPFPALVRRRFIERKDFMVELEHRVGDEVYRVEHPVSEARFMELAEGDELTVLCEPDDPKTSVLADAGVPALLP